MCGIAGIIRFDNQAVNESSLAEMSSSLKHRGPDGQGIWINKKKNLGFAHRRLSIIDLDERSAQPMHYDRFTITFNGEIYNHLELKEVLKKMGHTFKTTSDTEVLLAAYLEYGKAVCKHLDGMFAFAIYDEQKDEVFLARDRFGEKPFFYYQDDNQFVFASEIKAIATYGINLEVNESMLYRYLVFDLVENPDDLSETFYKDIFRIPPSTQLIIRNKTEQHFFKYWSLENNKRESTNNEPVNFNQLFKKSVERRLRSDVQVGTSLSGGLDSSSILSGVCSFNKTPETFTARFDDAELDEGKYVDILQQRFGFQRNDVYPDVEGLAKELPNVFYHQEEPFGSSSIYAQWEVMKKAKSKDITVLIDGQGGDEILGGYFKYFQTVLIQEFRKNPITLFQNLSKLKKTHGFNSNIKLLTQIVLPGMYDTIRQNGILSQERKVKNKALNPDLVCEIDNPFRTFTNLNDNLKYETLRYGLGKLLRFADRNSMAHSREVRLPFLSHELVEMIFTLPPESKIKIPWTKLLLRNAMNKSLPEEICWRKDKKGFGPPQNKWMKTSKLEYLYNQSIDILKARNVINNFNAFSPWQIIMTAQLYSFTDRFK